MKIVGWTYVRINDHSEKVFAYEQTEKYKEGKFIVERAYVKKQTFEKEKQRAQATQ